MSKKHIFYVIVMILTIFGYNMFLIQRDDELFKFQYNQQVIKNLKFQSNNTIN